MKQTYAFNTEYNVERLNQIKQDITNGKADNVIKELQQTQMTHSTSGIELDNVRKVVENQYADALASGKVTKQEVEIIALQVSNDVAEYDRDTWQALGVASRGSLPEKAIQAVGNLVDKAADFIIGKPLRSLGFDIRFGRR
jgi:hypothetical protein